MIHTVCAVYDAASCAFMPPFCVQREGIAIRAFTDAVNSRNHPLSEHPEDYTLYLIGEFNDTTGEFTNSHHQKLQTGLGVVRRTPVNETEV